MFLCRGGQKIWSSFSLLNSSLQFIGFSVFVWRRFSGENVPLTGVSFAPLLQLFVVPPIKDGLQQYGEGCGGRHEKVS